MTTAGSKGLSQWKPSYDATVVQRLKTAGVIILGKTNMHEWALGGTTINPFYGTTHNPWNLQRIAGGSSGGSAAAVASDTCMASIGTDSAQSVRNPASLCGVVGLKATYGRVSRFGAVHGTGGYSTDHVGILAKTVEDSSLILESIAGYDPQDPLSSDEPVKTYSNSLGKNVKGLRVGILKDFYTGLASSQVQTAFTDGVRVFQSLGMETEEVSIPHMDLVPVVKLATSRPENACAHDTKLRKGVRDYSPQTFYSYICALMIPAFVYVTAQRVRRAICNEFNAVFNRVDLLLLPTMLFPAPTIEECKEGYIDIDSRKVRRDSMGGIEGYCAVPFNLTGFPAISIPCGLSSLGLPIGMQVVGRDFQEDTVFMAAHAYEKAAGWYEKRPELGTF